MNRRHFVNKLRVGSTVAVRLDSIMAASATSSFIGYAIEIKLNIRYCAQVKHSFGAFKSTNYDTEILAFGRSES